MKGGTLRHRFGPNSQSWINQITEFFDAADYPIVGYRPPTVLTELHLNLLSCGIDYRYNPIRYLLAIEMHCWINDSIVLDRYIYRLELSSAWAR